MESWYGNEESEDDEIAQNMSKLTKIQQKELRTQKAEHFVLTQKIKLRNLESDPVNHYLKAQNFQQEIEQELSLQERLAPKNYDESNGIENTRKTCPGHKASHFVNLLSNKMNWPLPKVTVWGTDERNPNMPPFSVSIQGCGFMFIMHDMYRQPTDNDQKMNPTNKGWNKAQCKQIAYDSFITVALYPEDHRTDEDYSELMNRAELHNDTEWSETVADHVDNLTLNMSAKARKKGTKFEIQTVENLPTYAESYNRALSIKTQKQTPKNLQKQANRNAHIDSLLEPTVKPEDSAKHPERNSIGYHKLVQEVLMECGRDFKFRLVWLDQSSPKYLALKRASLLRNSDNLTQAQLAEFKAMENGAKVSHVELAVIAQVYLDVGVGEIPEDVKSEPDFSFEEAFRTGDRSANKVRFRDTKTKLTLMALDELHKRKVLPGDMVEWKKEHLNWEVRIREENNEAHNNLKECNLYNGWYMEPKFEIYTEDETENLETPAIDGYSWYVAAKMSLHRTGNCAIKRGPIEGSGQGSSGCTSEGATGPPIYTEIVTERPYRYLNRLNINKLKSDRVIPKPQIRSMQRTAAVNLTNKLLIDGLIPHTDMVEFRKLEAKKASTQHLLDERKGLIAQLTGKDVNDIPDVLHYGEVQYVPSVAGVHFSGLTGPVVFGKRKNDEITVGEVLAEHKIENTPVLEKDVDFSISKKQKRYEEKLNNLPWNLPKVDGEMYSGALDFSKNDDWMCQ